MTEKRTGGLPIEQFGEEPKRYPGLPQGAPEDYDAQYQADIEAAQKISPQLSQEMDEALARAVEVEKKQFRLPKGALKNLMRRRY